MATKKQPRTLEDFKTLIQSELLKRLSDLNIEYEVKRRLDDAATEMVLKALGFSNHWGDWEIDHCNGRQSEVTKFIREKGQAAVLSWFEEQLSNLPSLPPKAIKDAKEEYLHKLNYEVRVRLAEAAKEKSKSIVQDILNELYPEPTEETSFDD
jgi:hypothetical protein